MGSAELMLFGGLLLAGFSVYLFVSSLLAGKPGESQLSWASGIEPVKSKNGIINLCRPLVHQFTLQHAARIKSEKYRKKIRHLIKVGGLGAELNEDEFIGLQLFLGVAFPIFLTIMNFSLDLGFPPFFVVGLGLFGFMMPEMHCKGTKKNRELSVRADMPFFIDLLALSVEAGLDFFGAIQKIVDKVADENSVLAEEFKTVLKDIKIKEIEQNPVHMFFSYNKSLGPPYHIIIDTNFINLSIQNKIDLFKITLTWLMLQQYLVLLDNK